MSRIVVVIVVILICAVVASASAVLVVYYPPTDLQGSSSPNVFDVDLTYAFTGLTNATGEGHDHFGWGIETYPSDYYPVTAILNLTYLGNPQNQPLDVICEGYAVNFTADTGASVSCLGWLGTNYNVSTQSPPMFSSRETPWGNFPRMFYRFNMTVGDTYLLRVTDTGMFSSVNGTSGLWSNGTPNTIAVTVQRVGWLTAQGNQTASVVNPAANEIIQQIQLHQVGVDFSFGTYPSGRVY
jgi:hypothetical protein